MSIWPFKEEWHGIQWRELSEDISQRVTMGSLIHVLVTVLPLTPTSHVTHPHDPIFEHINPANWNATIHSVLYFYISQHCCFMLLLLGSVVSRAWMKLPSGLFLTSEFHQPVEIHIIWSCGEPLAAQLFKVSLVVLLLCCKNVWINMLVSRLSTFTSSPSLMPHFLHV